MIPDQITLVTSPDCKILNIHTYWEHSHYEIANYNFLFSLYVSSGGRILVDTKGEFSWTKKVNSRGHFW